MGGDSNPTILEASPRTSTTTTTTTMEVKPKRSKSQTRSRRRSSSVTTPHERPERRTHSLDASRSRRRRSSYQDLSQSEQLPSDEAPRRSSSTTTSSSTKKKPETRYQKMASKDKRMSQKAREVLATATAEDKPGLSTDLTGTSTTSLSTSISSKRSSNSKKSSKSNNSSDRKDKNNKKNNNNKQLEPSDKKKRRSRSHSKDTRSRSRSISVSLRKGKRSSQSSSSSSAAAAAAAVASDHISLLDELKQQEQDQSDHVRRPSLDMTSINPQILQSLTREDMRRLDPKEQQLQQQQRMGMSLTAIDKYNRNDLLSQLRADKSSRSARRASARDTSIERSVVVVEAKGASSCLSLSQRQTPGENSREDRSPSPDPLMGTRSPRKNANHNNYLKNDESGRTEMSTPSPEPKIRKPKPRKKSHKDSMSQSARESESNVRLSRHDPMSQSEKHTKPLRLSIREVGSLDASSSTMSQSTHSAITLRRSVRDTPSILEYGQTDPLSQSTHRATPALRKSIRDTPSIREYEQDCLSPSGGNRPSLHRSFTLPEQGSDHNPSPMSQSGHGKILRGHDKLTIPDLNNSSHNSPGKRIRPSLDRSLTMPDEPTEHNVRGDTNRLSDHLMNNDTSTSRRSTRRSDGSVSSRSSAVSARRRVGGGPHRRKTQTSDEPPPLINEHELLKKGRRHTSPVPIKNWNSLVNPTSTTTASSVVVAPSSSESCESSRHSSHHNRSFLPKHLSTGKHQNNPLQESFSSLASSSSSRHQHYHSNNNNNLESDREDDNDVFHSIPSSPSKKANNNSHKTNSPPTPPPTPRTTTIQFQETPETHLLEDTGPREWYSKDDLTQLMDHEVRMAMRAGQYKSLPCCLRGLEHLQDKVDKEKKTREHVMSIRLKQFTLRTKQKKGEDLDVHEEIRNYSRARTKEDRKKAFLLGQQDAKFVMAEANAERDREAKEREESGLLRSSHHSGSMGQLMSAAANKASKRVSTARSNASRLVTSAVEGASELLGGGPKRTEKPVPRFGDMKFGRLASSKNLV